MLFYLAGSIRCSIFKLTEEPYKPVAQSRTAPRGITFILILVRSCLSPSDSRLEHHEGKHSSSTPGGVHSPPPADCLPDTYAVIQGEEEKKGEADDSVWFKVWLSRTHQYLIRFLLL